MIDSTLTGNEMHNSTLNRSHIISTLIALAAPIALQNLIGAGLNLVDNIMIGSMGSKNISGVALANQVFFIFVLFLYGIGSGAAIYFAQFWGKKDEASLRKYLGIAYTFAVAGALLFFVPSYFFPRAVMGFFSSDPGVVDSGASFLHIMSIGFVFNAISMVLINALRSIERVRLPLVASAIALGLNTLLNYLLIFGNAGLPRMGIEGAAVATAVSRVVECAILLGGVYLHRTAGQRHPYAAKFGELFAFGKAAVKDFVKLTWPVVGNEVGWALGAAVPAFVFAHMNSEYLASFNIADTAIKFAIVVFFGTTSANAVLVGKAIGAGKAEEAFATARFFGLAAPLIGVAVGLFLASTSLFVPGFFDVPEATRYNAALAIIVFAVNVPLRSFTWHMVIGVFRAGGDTRFGLFLDLGMTWLFGVPMCLLFGLGFGFPFWLVYLAALLEDIPKIFLSIWRLKSKRWLNDVTARS